MVYLYVHTHEIHRKINKYWFYIETNNYFYLPIELKEPRKITFFEQRLSKWDKILFQRNNLSNLIFDIQQHTVLGIDFANPLLPENEYQYCVPVWNKPLKFSLLIMKFSDNCS